MPDLLDEIKDDLFREKYSLLWEKYGNYIIGAALAAIILTGFGVAGNKYMNSRYESYSDALYEADTAQGEDAIKKYDGLMENGNGTYKAIAGLRKAALLLKDSKNPEALAVYKKVIEESGGPKELKDVAKLLYISVSSNLAVGNKEYNDADAKKYLEENSKGNNVFKYSSMEIEAFKEIDNNNYTKAKDIFSKLVENPEAPANIKNRAREMIDAIANMNDSGIENATENKNG